ncbi:MAG: glycosyltransferase family 4 protein [Chitinispirillaceae bacterium]|nr:glycosyltransferase family 4 protein [Chitinispirillaceae bacterium]
MDAQYPRNMLMLSHEFPPLGGGGGRVLAMLCEELQRRGIVTTVCTAAPPRAIRREFPFPVIYFPTFRRARFVTSVPAMLLFIIQTILLGISGGLKGFDFLVSNMSIPAGIAGIVLRRLLNVPHAVWYHNTEVTQNRAHGAGVLFRRAFLFIARRASVNFFISPGLLDLAKSYGVFPCPVVLPNAVKVVSGEPSLYRGGRKQFLFAARMEGVKNPLVLLHAVRLLAGKGRLTDVQFRLVGSGRQYRMVRKAIRSYGLEANVTLDPVVPHERMADFYRSSYALVIPSVVEGYPTTILEAGAYGVPAIGSDAIGNRDAILHNETGILCRLNDVEDLAAAILRLSADPELRNRLGINAGKRSRTFSISRTADAFLSGISISAEYPGGG